MAKKTITSVNPTELAQNQKKLYEARVKHTLKSLDKIHTLRATKKLIAQQKTALTAK